MLLTVDTDTNILRLTDGGCTTELPLFSAAAFEALSRQWLALGWNLEHWSTFSWMGRQILQFPDDVLRLGEALWKLRPDLVLETGAYDGGSALFFATFCPRVISIEKSFRPGVREAIRDQAGDRITLIEADSADRETAEAARNLIRREERVFVFLDSDHSEAHVSAELDNFAGCVTPGSYLVVADSNLPELAHTPSGDERWVHNHPAKAVERFLASHPEFSREIPRPMFPAGFDVWKLSYFPDSWMKRC